MPWNAKWCQWWFWFRKSLLANNCSTLTIFMRRERILFVKYLSLREVKSKTTNAWQYDSRLFMTPGWHQVVLKTFSMLNKYEYMHLCISPWNLIFIRNIFHTIGIFLMKFCHPLLGVNIKIISKLVIHLFWISTP